MEYQNWNTVKNNGQKTFIWFSFELMEIKTEVEQQIKWKKSDNKNFNQFFHRLPCLNTEYVHEIRITFRA